MTWIFWVLLVVAALVLALFVRGIAHRRELERDDAMAQASWKMGAEPTALVTTSKLMTLVHNNPGWLDETDTMPAVTTENTVILEPVGEPRAAKRRLVRVEDELGTWQPSAHEQVDPLILGDVLSWRKWHHVRPSDVGMGPS